jgi:hypothetical protein
LRELRELDSGFDTTTLIRSRTKYQGNQSVLAEIKMKKVSGKLNRLCYMRFLAREKVKRQIFVRDNVVCFRGYKYRYKLTKQSLSYLKYLSEKRRLKNNTGFSKSPHSDPASAVGMNLAPNIEELVNRKIEQREDEWARALLGEHERNRLLEQEFADERFQYAAIMAETICKAREQWKLGID